MKFRKSAIVLIAAVLLLAAAFIYFDTRLLNKMSQTSHTQDGSQTKGQTGLNGNGEAAGSEGRDSALPENTADGSDQDTSEEELTASENVIVDFNTPEYDIEVTLCENTDKKTFLRLKYYIDGVSSVNDLDEEQIPELANIFENREKESANAGGMQSATPPYAIGQTLLNPVYGQLYILINGAPLDVYTQSSFYVIDLYDISVKKLFSYPAKYGKMSFSSDFALLAYDFEDPPLMSMYQEDSLFEVYSCNREEFLVRGSRRPDQSLIGPDSDPGYIYDYTFKGWKASDTVKLIRASRPKGAADAEPILAEVIYDVSNDKMFNTDGSEISIIDGGQGNAPNAGADKSGGTDGNGAKAGGKDAGTVGEQGQKPGDGTADAEGSESEPVKQLKSFYSYLGSASDYDKAMKLIDDEFILRLGMLKQFGIDEIHKSDIDAQYNQNNVSMYAELLKAAKFERLVSADISGNGVAQIKYYQILGLAADSQVSQLMSARLEKKDKVWIIKLIEDGKQ